MSRKAPEKPEKPAQADDRQRRLAEALRANLRRRKAAGRNGGQTATRKPEEGGE
jgi:hypothetical protein